MLCSKKPKPRPAPRKPIQDSRFSMKMSSEWVDQTSFYYIEGPEDDGIKHHIRVQIEEEFEEADIKEFAEMKIKNLSNTLQTYQELKQGPVRLNNKPIPAYEVVYKWKVQDKREVYQRMMYVLSKKTAFILTATFSEKTFKRLGPQVEMIFKSFGLS